MSEEDGTLIAELVRLAQRELNGDTLLSYEAGFARLEARILRQRGVRPTRALVGGSGLVLAGAVASAFLLHLHARPLTFDVAGATLGERGQVIAEAGSSVRFSDGSEADLARGTEARIQNLTEHGAEVVLTRGRMRVHIKKKPQASWKVAAGPYDVRVTGTAFDVSWSNETQIFDIRMETGSVVVTGPMARSIPLEAGQHMFGRATTGQLIVERRDASSVPAPASDVAAGSSAAALDARIEGAREPPASASPPSPALVPHASTQGHSWRHQVANGHFNAVLEHAEHRGLERTLGTGTLEELSALADAARYAGQSALAKRVLLAERQRFPSSSAALDAAFFLGRIAEDSGAGGIDWYERYLSESPRGAFASQAHGRKMMLLYKQRGVAAASAAAAEYLSRYPKGPYAAAARKLAEESQSAPTP